MRVLKYVLSAGLVGFVLIAPPIVPPAAAAQTPPRSAERVDDGTLKTRVAAKLKENTLLAVRRVDVSVRQGVVTLKGTVRTAEEKTNAAKLATMNGVTAVRNELVIDAAVADSKADQAIGATTRGVQKAAETTADAVQKAGEKTKEATGKAATKTKELVGKEK